MSKLDDIFKDAQVRITADVPAHNFLVRLENEAAIKQAVKELFTMLANKHVTSTKDVTKLRREISKL